MGSPGTTAGRLPRSDADPLTETLALLRLSGTLYCAAELTAPWGIAIPAFENVMTFAMVTTGSMWVDQPEADPVFAGPGTLLLFPHGRRHAIGSAPDAALTPLEEVPVTPISEHYETARLGGGGALTRVLYGVHRIEHAAARRLIDTLPPLLRLDSWEGGEGADWIASTLRLIAREARTPRPCGEIVVSRLADVLVVQMIRTWLESDTARRGWLAALRDPQLGGALRAVHRAPESGWTTARLAREAGMSRSAFAARFRAVVGEPAMAYVTDWRMRLACTQLAESRASVGEVAAGVGYASEASFGRAFKRLVGVSPGRYRERRAGPNRASGEIGPINPAG